MINLDLQPSTELRKDQNVTNTPMQEINEAYKACKFGIFHVRLLLISFIGFVGGVLVSNTTAFLLSSAECDLNMTLVQKGLLNAMPYLGMLLSTIIGGFLTDTFGRKKFVVFGYGGVFVCTIIAGSSQNYEVLVTAKFFEGLLFAISYNAVLAMTSEFCHSDIRDRVMVCQSSFNAGGQIVAAVMSWGILTQDWRYSLFDGKFVLNTWNFYLYIMSLWSFFGSILYALFLPESPKYLLTQKKYDKVRDILIKMYCINTGKPAESYPYKDIWRSLEKDGLQNTPEKNIYTDLKHQIVVGLHTMKPLFRRPMIVYVIIICIMNFVIMAIYNIIRLWYPQLSTIVENYDVGDQDMCTMLDKYTNDLKLATLNSTLSDTCVSKKSGNETYINSIIIGWVCFFSFFTTGVLVNKAGKKPLLIISGLICTAMSLALRWASNKGAIVALFSIDVAIAQIMLSLNQAITVEYFPTTIRTLAISLMMTFGRMGTLVGNITFPILLSMGCSIPFYVMTGAMACITALSLLLRKMK